MKNTDYQNLAYLRAIIIVRTIQYLARRIIMVPALHQIKLLYFLYTGSIVGMCTFQCWSNRAVLCDILLLMLLYSALNSFPVELRSLRSFFIYVALKPLQLFRVITVFYIWMHTCFSWVVGTEKTILFILLLSSRLYYLRNLRDQTQFCFPPLNYWE